MAYRVKSGDTIYDAAFNVSGSLAGVDQLLEQNQDTSVAMLDWHTMSGRRDVPESNFMESYTPDLKVGQILNTDGVPKYNNEAVEKGGYNSSILDATAVWDEINGLLDILDGSTEAYLITESGDNIVTEIEGDKIIMKVWLT